MTNGPIDVAIQKEILSEAERLEVKDKAAIVLCEVLFRDPTKIPEKIKANRNLFLRVSLTTLMINIIKPSITTTTMV